MSFPISNSSIPARSEHFRVHIHDDRAEQRWMAAQSESKDNFPEISLEVKPHSTPPKVKIHATPQLVYVAPQQPKPPETLLGRLPGPFYLEITAFSKYKAIFNLSLTCHYFRKNLSVERMIEGTPHSPAQTWEKIAKNDYGNDYQDYIQKGLSIKSFEKFYAERSIFHHRLRTSHLSAFLKFDLPVKIETDGCNFLDANHNGIITLSQEIPTRPLICLWDMRTGSPLAGAIISNVTIFNPITVIRCIGTEIAYGNAEGHVQFLSIEDKPLTKEDEPLAKKSLEKQDLQERSLVLVEKQGFHIYQGVSALALSIDWQAVGTVGGQIRMRQKSSGRSVTLLEHMGPVDYLEFMNADWIASASKNSSRITIWHAQGHEGKADWKEENTSPHITLKLDNSPNSASPIRCLHWASPELLYSGSLDGTIRAWNPLTGQLLNQFFKVQDSPISSIQTAQGLIISTGEKGRLVLMDENGKSIQSTLTSKKRVKIIENKIVSVSLEGGVCVSMPGEKPVKTSPLLTKGTIARVTLLALVVIAIIVTLVVITDTSQE